MSASWLFWGLLFGSFGVGFFIDMTASPQRLQSRRRVIAIMILLAGVGSALVIYLGAKPVPPNPLGYEPSDSKQYLREMEVYGGKGNVLAYELREWFESLWHGRRLAFTVIVLTLVALLFYVVASTPLPPQGSPSPQREGKPDPIDR